MRFKIKRQGHDARSFDPAGVGEHPCPRCGRQVEFFPTDRSLKCPACGARFGNPASYENADGYSEKSARTEKAS